MTSRITAVTASMQPLGTFAGVPYVRTLGRVTGVVDPREAIVGLARQPRDAAGNVAYSAEYEIVAPAADARRNDVVYVDAENRGGPVSLAVLNGAAVGGAPSQGPYPAELGNGFLQRHATSYARVQWQTGIASGVPADAQGIGLAIVRDFGRMLIGRTAAPAGFTARPYGRSIFGGVSQSAWFVNDLIAEGFNTDPLTHGRVFDAALAVDGTGNWLAINRLGRRAGVPQAPYLAADGVPLRAGELLHRPASDPLYVDTANATDFYRLRASLTSTARLPDGARRYDWPSPHAAGPLAPSAATFPAACNGGAPISRNPMVYAPYMRALVIGIERGLGVASAASAAPLPPSAVFALAPAPRGGPGFNALPGMALAVPAVDEDAMPVGGVRFPDADHPLGRPVPPALAPVSTASIGATCGNFGGFAPFTAAQLAARYGSADGYAARYAASLGRLIAAGFLLAEDEQPMLARARELYAEAAALGASAQR